MSDFYECSDLDGFFHFFKNDTVHPKEWAPANLEIPEATDGASSSRERRLPLNA
jgi:hypothetical protein